MRKNEWDAVFSKITADETIKEKVMQKMNNPHARCKYRYIKPYAATAAVLAAIVCATTVFAASPAGQRMIAYFQSEKAVEISSLTELSKYNEQVGVSSTNLGYTLTLDNLAADDNFLHVFYTLKYNDGKLFEEGAESNNLWFQCRINGRLVGFGNHNEWEGYMVDDCTYKGMMKLNVASMDIPEIFKLEMYAEPDYKKDISAFEGDYLFRNDLALTDNDISKLVYVSTTAKKANVETNALTKVINKKFSLPYYDDHGNQKTGEAEILKAVFSPFGNQLVITDDCEGFGAMRVAGWALFDENGQSLDILNTDLSGSIAGQKTTNSLEFLKANANTKQLKLVPTKDVPADSNRQADFLTQEIGTYPMTFKVNDYGSIVVTDIRISNGEINIDYYKDGFSFFDPCFHILDKDGNNAEPGGKLGCTLYTRVHHDTNSYTAQYKYDAYDENGHKIPADESVSKENLEKTFTVLGIYANNPFTLDFDNAIDINLK